MALRTPLSVTPHLYMGDSTGRPLDKGVVYFGEQDKDPEFYPINLFSDDALTKPLAQPVHTKGGYLYDKGDMVEPHAKELIYSVKVLDSYGRKVFYKGAMMRNSWNDDVIEQINTAIIGSADVARQVAIDITNDAINNTAVEGGVLADTFVVVDGSLSQRTINKGLESIADLSTIKNPKDGLRVYVKSYFSNGKTGGGYFTYDASKAKSEADGGLVIDPDNIGGFDGTPSTHEGFIFSQGDYIGAKPDDHLNPNIPDGRGCWVRADANEYNIHYFGASPTHNSSPALNRALRQARLKNNQTVYVPRGVYELDEQVFVALQTNNFTFRGDGKGQSVLIIKNDTFLIGCYPENKEQDYHYKNFIVRGLTFKSDTAQPSNLVMDIVRHDGMEVHDCEFVEVQTGNHIIDFAGSSTLKVFNCDFLGRLGESRPFAECIQISRDSGGALGGFQDWAANLKGLSPKRVDIANCRFLPYVLPDGSISSGSASPFGNHGPIGEDCEIYIRDVEVRGNHNKDIAYTYSSPTSPGLSLWRAKRVILENVIYHGEWSINTSAYYLHFTDTKEVILRNCDFSFKITNASYNEFSDVSNVSKFTMDNCTFEVNASNNAHGLFTYYTKANTTSNHVSATEFTFTNSTIKSNIPGNSGRGLLRVYQQPSPALLHIKLNVSNCNLIYSGAGSSRLVMFGGSSVTPAGVVDGVISNNTFIGCEQLDHPTNWKFKWIIKDNTFDNMSGQIYKTETAARGNLVATDSTATAISQDSSVASGGLLKLL